MASGIDALTDKEKQTLRLLLQGHDAKTMARHLGLSVHTINERLRDARRKLATPSSREAARRLREVEADTPELLGDTGFGAVAVAASGALAGHQPSEAAAGWRPGWTIGGIAMLIALALAALTSPSGAGQVAQPVAESAVAAPSYSAAEIEATSAARRWLELVDAKDWQASYDLAGNAFRTHNTLASWATAALGVHGTFGPARRRELVSADETPAPPAGNVVVKFHTAYANKPKGTELLTLVREEGAWKVSGIYVD